MTTNFVSNQEFRDATPGLDLSKYTEVTLSGVLTKATARAEKFELENEMLEGEVRVADLPEAWNAKMEAYLGIVPPDDAQGVLQDIHWSGGMLGYFPTYSLGNLISVQFFDQVKADIPSLADQIAAGEFDELLDWLRENVHQYGRKYTPSELVKRVTGNDLTATNYIAYIKAKFSDIYDL